ncbi:RidA family protein [Paracoccus sp. MBLB3053]|uniref:RidA family protein n=1 Tax=Paracoccus aurantius TaxID=3073814 RepID=A0ABU2HX81_9RHOB|nr:RidA family protein [Paracoccus sp. MBLB3053]MDS9469352.1 RidA family protein [Paracoccus sp. MBLB3053]
MTFVSPTATPEQRLNALGICLPKAAPTPIGSFRNLRRQGNCIYVSGQGPIREDGTLMRGKVGGDVSAEEARDHARLVALNILAVLREELGSLDEIGGVVKLLGLVNAEPDFEAHPQVIDGASELLHQVFGEEGVHARSSFGVGSLPNRITVEIEAIFELAQKG